MPKIIPENERTKRAYLTYLKEAKGRDEASLDKVAAALRDFEGAIGDLSPKFPPAIRRIRVLISGLMRPAFATSFWPRIHWA